MSLSTKRAEGSLLAVRVHHPSCNASGNSPSSHGDWQQIAGVLTVAAAALVLDVARSRFDAGIPQSHGTPHAAPTTPVN